MIPTHFKYARNHSGVKIFLRKITKILKIFFRERDQLLALILLVVLMPDGVALAAKELLMVGADEIS